MKIAWNKVTWYSMVLAVVLFVAVLILGIFIGIQYNQYQIEKSLILDSKISFFNPKNCTYLVAGRQVTLNNGYFEELAVENSSSKNIINYFGNEAKADLNGDGSEDVVFLISEDKSGTGLFYYAVAALRSGTNCLGTNAIFLGDRIAPQTTEFRNNQIIINYADRNPGQSMTDRPSLGVSKYLQIKNGQLIESPK